jgi:hypothetical protein
MEELRRLAEAAEKHEDITGLVQCLLKVNFLKAVSLERWNQSQQINWVKVQLNDDLEPSNYRQW